MLIRCQDLTKKYVSDSQPFFAVDDVSLDVARGDFIVILGHSGSGKTTLLSLIGGLTRPDKGEVFIDGIGNWQLPDRELARLRNKKIGFIFQFASLIPTLTVVENILLPLSFGERSVARNDYAMELLNKVGLSDKVNAFPGQLSGGQQRRVAIARSFINNPDIILADEPTGDLDEKTEADILEIFSEFNRKQITFLVVTHNVVLAERQLNRRVLTMKHGKVYE